MVVLHALRVNKADLQVPAEIQSYVVDSEAALFFPASNSNPSKSDLALLDSSYCTRLFSWLFSTLHQCLHPLQWRPRVLSKMRFDQTNCTTIFAPG